MALSETVRTAVGSARSAASLPSSTAAAPRLTIYGCGQDEAVMFRELAPRFGLAPITTASPVSEANVALATGSRCISVGHKTQVTGATLLALRRAGVTYISTRSIGYDHIDVACAERLGICVEHVVYSPESVADYTLMVMLMAIRHAKSIISRAAVHDFRLLDVRGRDLRQLTVGVIGTGRIGAAVVERLRGFGCRIVAHDRRPNTSVDYLDLDALLQQSDIVTLHTPLNPDTHHLLNRHRIGLMKRGAFLINTGRGALIDTEALVAALEDGGLGGAALDVLEGEEGIFYADCRDQTITNEALVRLQALPNVIVTPHTAYYTDRSLSDMVAHTIGNCLRHAGGNQDA
jgi:D-specific alpha-keto acid dehydrogenase